MSERDDFDIKHFSDDELWRYATMDIIQLIEHPIGKRLLNNFLLTEDRSGNSIEQRMIKRYRLSTELLEDITKLYCTKYYLKFVALSPSTRWKNKVEENLYVGSEELRRLLDQFYQRTKNELRNESVIMLIFRGYIATEIKRRSELRAQNRLNN